MSDEVEAGLRRAIGEDIDDPRPWLVYADWLQQRGHPRGELMSIHIAAESESGARKKELEEAATNLIREHGKTLAGEHLGPFVLDGYGEFVWHRGFIRSLSYGFEYPREHPRAAGWLVERVVAAADDGTYFLRRLALPHTDITDVTPLAVLPHLDTLELPGVHLDPLTQLDQLPALRHVDLTNGRIDKRTALEWAMEHPDVTFLR